MKIAIVQARWNKDITDILAQHCEDGLKKHNVNIVKYQVAGAVELPVMAKNIIVRDESIDSVICIGAVVQGETDHYKFVSEQASFGCQQVALDTGVPVIFGVLTTQTKELALNRANGVHSNSGLEWAETAVEMVSNIRSLINHVNNEE